MIVAGNLVQLRTCKLCNFVALVMKFEFIVVEKGKKCEMIIQFEPETSMQVDNYNIIAYSVHPLPMDNCSHGTRSLYSSYTHMHF
jgi:hypothetical protein